MTRVALSLLAGSFVALSPNIGAAQEPTEPDPSVIVEEDESEYEPATFQSSWQDSTRIAEKLEETLSSRMHSFCRRGDHELAPDERSLCGLAEAARERCPEFAAACARTAPPKEEPSGLGSALLGLVGMLGFILFWCLIGGLVFLLVGLLVRSLGLYKPSAAVTESDEAPLVPGSKPEGFERDVALHLSRCRSLAESGDYREALVELHLAVVLSLDARGLIHARRGRTNGEYARELRPEPELGAAFREVTNATEAVHFGGRSIDAAGFERVMARAHPLLAGLGLAVLLLVTAVGCNEAREVYRPSNACGTRAAGNSVLCSLLELSGDVRRRYRPLDEIEEDVARIVVLPNSLEETSWTALAAWVESGGLAVLTTKAGSLDDRFGVERNGKPCGEGAVMQDPALLKLLGYAPRLSAFGDSLGVAQLQTDALCSDSGELYAGHVDLGAGRIVFLPTPELLSNASLAAGENAYLLMSLISISSGRTDIVGNWTGSASGSPFESVSSARLWPWLLQLLLLGLAFARFRGAPFGRRTPPPEDRRRRFSEHVSALGQRWAEAGASRTALAAYAAWAFEVLRERVPSGAERGIGELARVISTKTGRSDAEVARILANARLAQSEPVENDEKRDLDTLRRLGRLITEMGGPR